jgi:CRISPR-associated protein Cmr5
MSDTAKAGKPTLEQRRADHAWKAAGAIADRKAAGAGADKSEEAKRKFGGQARKLPTRIIASGLGQALAYLKAKGYAPDLLAALGDWVLDKRDNPDSKAARPKDDALLLAVIGGNADFLRRATDEVLAYLLWLNRFVEALGLAKDVE